MSPENTIPDKTRERIIAELHRSMRRLLGVEGYSVAEILVVMHAEVIIQIAGFFGGEAAAECAERAAKRVVRLPQNPVCPTSSSEFAGRVQ